MTRALYHEGLAAKITKILATKHTKIAKAYGLGMPRIRASTSARCHRPSSSNLSPKRRFEARLARRPGRKISAISKGALCAGSWNITQLWYGG